jgi:hypothetical protein
MAYTQLSQVIRSPELELELFSHNFFFMSNCTYNKQSLLQSFHLLHIEQVESSHLSIVCMMALHLRSASDCLNSTSLLGQQVNYSAPWSSFLSKLLFKLHMIGLCVFFWLLLLLHHLGIWIHSEQGESWAKPYLRDKNWSPNYITRAEIKDHNSIENLNPKFIAFPTSCKCA